MKRTFATSLMMVLCAFAGSPASAGKPSFEAATIKLAAVGANPLPVAPSAPNRLRIPSMTLTQLIYTAYGNGGFNTSMRVTGGPDWDRGQVHRRAGFGRG